MIRRKATGGSHYVHTDILTRVVKRNIQCYFLCFFKSFRLCETWAVREGDKYRITSARMKFVRRKQNTQSKVTNPMKILVGNQRDAQFLL